MSELILVEYRVNSAGAVTGQRRVAGGNERVAASAKKATGGFTKMAAAAGIAFAAFSALRRVTRLLGQALTQAGIRLITERKLEAALRNLNGLLGKTNASIKDEVAGLRELSGELSRFTNFAEDQITTAAAFLASFQEIAGPEGVAMLTPRLLDAAAGVARFTGETVDLNQVAALAGKALAGQAAGLRRVGISLSDAQIEAINMAEGLDKVRILSEVLDQNFAGLAVATANSFTIMSNAINEAKADLGVGFRGAVEDVANRLSSFLQRESFREWLRQVGEGIGVAVTETGNFIRSLGSLAIAFGRTGGMMSGFGIIGTSIVRLFGNLERWGLRAAQAMLITRKVMADLFGNADDFKRFSEELDRISLRLLDIDKMLGSGIFDFRTNRGATPEPVAVPDRETAPGGGSTEQLTMDGDVDELTDALDDLTGATERVTVASNEADRAMAGWRDQIMKLQAGALQLQEATKPAKLLDKEGLKVLHMEMGQLVNEAGEVVSGVASIGPAAANMGKDAALGFKELGAAAAENLGLLAEHFRNAGQSASGFFAVYKAIAIAQAMIDAFAAANAAYKAMAGIPFVGPVLGAAAATAAMVAGLINANRIRQMQPGGAGGGSAASSPRTPSSPAASGPSGVYAGVAYPGSEPGGGGSAGGSTATAGPQTVTVEVIDVDGIVRKVHNGMNKAGRARGTRRLVQ